MSYIRNNYVSKDMSPFEDFPDKDPRISHELVEILSSLKRIEDKLSPKKSLLIVGEEVENLYKQLKEG